MGSSYLLEEDRRRCRGFRLYGGSLGKRGGKVVHSLCSIGPGVLCALVAVLWLSFSCTLLDYKNTNLSLSMEEVCQIRGLE